MPKIPSSSIVLVNPHPEKQAAFMVGRVIQKMGMQDKGLDQALLETVAQDNATIANMLIAASNDPKVLKKLSSELVFMTAQVNLASDDPASLAVQGAILSQFYQETFKKYDYLIEKSSKKLTKRIIARHLTAIEDEKKRLKQVDDIRPKKLGLSWHDGCRERKAKIVNKPKSNLQNPSQSDPFNLNRFRGGGHDSSNTIVEIDVSKINDDIQISSFIEEILQHHKKISYLIIFGTIVYIIFKKRKFIRKFIRKISKILGKIFKIYKIISNNFLFTNRISKAIFIFYKVVGFNG